VTAISSTDSTQAGSQTKAVPEDGKDGRIAGSIDLSKNAPSGLRGYNNNIDSRVL